MRKAAFGQIGITEPQVDLLSSAERFCRENSPVSRVRELIETPLGFDQDVWAQIGALGWLGVTIPERFGGSGLSMTEVVPLAEQMGRRMMTGPFAATTLAAQAILDGGTQEQKETILPRIATGAAATLALYEAGADWDLTAIEARAAGNKDGGYSFTGTKQFVADLAASKFVIISAVLDGAPALFVIETAQISEKSIRRETLIDETKRAYALDLSGLTVSASAIMDTAAAGKTLDHIDVIGALLSAADMTGACQACIDYTAEYLKTRKQFGKLIGSFQALKHPLVNAFVDYQNARSLLYAAAYSFAPGNIRQGEGEIAVRMAKAKAETTLSFAADRSIQFHGGFGFTYDCDAQLYRRRAIFQSSQFGDARAQKQKLAALLF